MRIWCCWRWVSPARCEPGLVEQLGVEVNVRGNIATDDNYQPRYRTSLQPAICAAVNRWLCGRLRKGGRRLERSICT